MKKPTEVGLGWSSKRSVLALAVIASIAVVTPDHEPGKAGESRNERSEDEGEFIHQFSPSTIG